MEATLSPANQKRFQDGQKPGSSSLLRPLFKESALYAEQHASKA